MTPSLRLLETIDGLPTLLLLIMTDQPTTTATGILSLLVFVKHSIQERLVTKAHEDHQELLIEMIWIRILITYPYQKMEGFVAVTILPVTALVVAALGITSLSGVH